MRQILCPVLLLACSFVGTAMGQKPTESTPSKSGIVKQRKADISLIKKCRELAALEESALDGFREVSVPKLEETSRTVHACLDSYDELTKYQLAALGNVLGWTQYLIDHEDAIKQANKNSPSKEDIFDQVASESKDASTVSRANEVPQLSTGKISLYPLDMGQTFSVLLDSQSLTCKATSTQQLECSAGDGGRKYFLGAIAEQDRHEYLIGCVQTLTSETCMGLSAGVYTVLVHSRTVTILDSGMGRIKTETGKSLGPLTPVFSIFSVLK